MLAIGLWAHGVPALLRPIGGYVIGGLAGLGLLYLVVGVHGSQGARFDLLQAFWWCAAAAGCAALLVFKGIV
jgi:hypothetical protein